MITSTATKAHPATVQVAAFVASTRYASLPREVIARAKDSFLDTLGIAMAGAAERGGAVITRHALAAGGKPESSIIGCDTRVPARSAAAANGTLAHLVGFSDFSVPNVMHPSVAVLPAVWALAEARLASGRDALLAHVLGVEVACKIAQVLTPGFTERGFHPCAVVGTFGAAAAAAKLTGLDEAGTANALGIAGVRAAGIKVSLGTLSKAYAVGNAAEGGVVAAELAALGFTGAHDVLEGRDGFFQTFGAGAGADAHDFGAELGHPYEFQTPGITIKPYPACTRSHPAIDAALEIAARGNLRPEAIESVECEVAPAVLRVVKVEKPRNPMEAKFSLPFCMSAALLDGKVVMETFSEETLGAARVQALMRKVRSRPLDRLSQRGAFAAQVTVTMSDGTTLKASADRNLWDQPDVESAEKRSQLLRKYESCAARVLSDSQIRETLTLLEALEEEPSLERLMAILRTPARQRDR